GCATFRQTRSNPFESSNAPLSLQENVAKGPSNGELSLSRGRSGNWGQVIRARSDQSGLATSEHTGQERSELTARAGCPSTRVNAGLARDTTRLRSLRSRVEWWRR